MFGRFRFGSFSKSKPFTIAVIAVTVSILFLIWIQYRSLSDLEDKTTAALNENLRRSMLAIASRAGDEVRDIAIKTLHGIEVRDYEEKEIIEIESCFAQIRRENPQVRDLFLIPLYQDNAEKYAVFSVPDEAGRLVKFSEFGADPAVSDAINNFKAAQYSRISIDLKNDLIFWTAISSKDGEFRAYIFYPLLNQKTQTISGFAGLTLEQNYIKEQLLPKIITLATIDNAEAGESSNIDVAVVYDQKHKLYESRPDVDNFEIRVPFLPAFPNWFLAAGHKNTTIGQLAQDNFQKTLAFSLAGVSLLIAGMILTLRAVSRETKLAEAKSTFVSNVSHELKTPLALIRLFAETLELGRVKDRAKAQEYYRIINSESRRLTQLIDNILDFSQIEAGLKGYQFITANVAETVEDVIETYKPHLVNAGFRFRINIEPDLPPVSFDRHAIAQAVLNLLSNAIKYSSHNKQLIVTVCLAGNNVLIIIEDKGIGIPPAERKKVFDKFYRINTGLVHKTKGSGLGLSLVKHIVAAHRGRIYVESKPEKGSTFTISLPVSSMEKNF